MRILAFSGWSQRADALAAVLPEGAEYFDYGSYPSYSAFAKALETARPDVVISWSLGGQVALRAISEGIIAPKHLVLLATHYQAWQSADNPAAAAPAALAKLQDEYLANPDTMLKSFYLTCAYGDANQRKVMAGMQASKSTMEGHHWHYWLKELSTFTCETLEFAKIPPATLIYGAVDCIVPVGQAHRMAEKITDAMLHILPDCAHAPHLHSPERIRDIISSVG